MFKHVCFNHLSSTQWSHKPSLHIPGQLAGGYHVHTIFDCVPRLCRFNTAVEEVLAEGGGGEVEVGELPLWYTVLYFLG